MNLGTVFLYIGSAGEAAVIGLLLFKGIWRRLPIFFAYSTWTLIGNTGGYLIFRGQGSEYVTAYLTVMIVDSVLLFGVLVELAWSVLRPVRALLPRATIVVVVVLILVLGAAIWPFAGILGAAQLTPEKAILAHVQQTVSILSIVIFLILAAGSQLLSIGWRDRELQITTGLGFYSLISLIAAVIDVHDSTWAQYRHVDEYVVASYLFSLVYWIVSFVQKEAERKEFTPQMQSFLLALAGATRASRVSLADARSRKVRQKEER